MLEPLRSSPVFLRLWLGALISGLGDGLTWIALQWLILERTNDSGTAVGLMLLCFGLPAVLTGTLIGRLIDRFGAVPVMIIDNLARAVIIVAIPLLDLFGLLEIWHVFVIAALCGALLPASQVGIRALVPRLVPNAQLEAGIALTQQVVAVGPPILAGFLIQRFGTSSALWVDGLSFVLFVLLLLTIPNLKSDANSPDSKAVGSDSLESESLRPESLRPESLRPDSLRSEPNVRRNAWQELSRHPTFLSLVLLNVAFYAAYGPLEAALPLLVKHDLNSGAEAYGLLWTISGIGMILGNLVFSKALSRLPAGLVLSAITLAWGVSQLLMAFAPNMVYLAVWMFTAGLVWGPYSGLESTVAQRLIPPESHGRMFGAQEALVGPSGPLGMALGGLMLAFLSSRWVLGLSALACVIAALIAFASPRMRNLEQDFIQEKQ
jgi:MFS family permease